MVRHALPLVLLFIGCGDPTPTAETASNGASGGSSGEQGVALQEHAVNQPAETNTDLSARIELVRDTLPAGADPSSDQEAQLAARLYVRNEGREARELDFAMPASFGLDWTLTAADGTVYVPTFFSPEVPGPGAPPRGSLFIDAGTEFPEAIAILHGISGFFKEGTEMEGWGPLPAGRYDVVVRNVQLDEGPALSTPPVVLTVR